MQKPRLSVLCLLVFMLPAFPALAWNHTGHKIVAELAWRELASGERRAISDLLRQHPHYALLLATNVPAGVDTNEWAFMNAAVWPDMVRPSRGGEGKPTDITKYHRGPWHYINIPYVWPADADHVSAASFAIPATNIVWALTNSLANLRDRHAAPAERAVSLCWVLHLVGDLHQPLHAATLLSSAYPQGDQGGNLLAVADASQTPLNLHSFWDQLLDAGDSYVMIATMADTIGLAPEYDPRKLKDYRINKTAWSWAEESFAAATAFAYAEGQLKFVNWRDFSSGKLPSSDVPRLKSTYVINANDVARRRVSLAGQRLADALKQSF